MRLLPAAASQANRRQPARRRGRLMALTVAAGTLAAAGCSAGGSNGAAAGTITVAAVPGVPNAPLYYANHDGLFANAGLTIKIRNFSTVSAEVTALQRGQVDIAAGDYGNFFFAQGQAASSGQFKIVAAGYAAGPSVVEVLTYPGSPVNNPADLVTPNVKVGLPSDDALPGRNVSPPSLEAAATQSVLSAYVAAKSSEVNWVELSQAQEVAQLRTHKIQAALLTEPYIYQAETDFGATEVLDACSGATASLPLSGYFAMSAWSAHNPAAIADFQSAIEKAQAVAAMPGPVQSVLPAATHMSAQDASLVTVGSFPTTTNSIAIQRVADLMWDDALTPKAVNVPKMIIK
jgi:NitT/TauT family transport system substrate-binding protein